MVRCTAIRPLALRKTRYSIPSYSFIPMQALADCGTIQRQTEILIEGAIDQIKNHSVRVLLKNGSKTGARDEGSGSAAARQIIQGSTRLLLLPKSGVDVDPDDFRYKSISRVAKHLVEPMPRIHIRDSEVRTFELRILKGSPV